MKKIRFFLLFTILAHFGLNAQCTQQVIWTNPSFEGAAQPHVLPAPWSNCNGTTTDTQPGSWGITAPPTNGSTYAGLVSTSGWEETASQTFSPCLNAGQTFNFTADLIKLDEQSDGGGDCDGWLQLWGGNSSGSACDQDELLWSGPMMTTGGSFQNAWQTVTISFTPTQSTCQLTFIAKGGTCYGAGNFYMGMDNLSAITPNITASPSVNNNVSCSGGSNGSASVSASGGQGPYNYSWSNGGSGPTQTNLGAGTYTVNITDANGCPSSTTLSITQPPAISATLSPTASNCGQPDGSISTSAGGGTGGLSYSWSPAGGNTQNPGGLTPGNYSVVITDANGCSNTFSTTVGNSGSVSSPFSTNSSTQCLNGNSFVFTNTGSSGGGISQSWDFGDGSPAVSTVNASYSYSSAGTYTVTHVVSQGGCNSVSTTQVSVIQDPDANAGSTSVITCSNTTAMLDGSTSTGGAVLTWNGPGLSNAPDPATAMSAGTYTLTSNNSGCMASATIVVNANTAAPDAGVSASNTTLDCANPNAILTGSSATGGVSLAWSGPSGAIAGNPITVSSAGTYTLTVTDPSNGCTASQTQTITSNGAIPDISLAGSDDTLDCIVSSITLTGSSTTSGAVLSWDGPAGPMAGNPVSANAPGTYTLTVNDPANNCSVTQTFVVGQNTTSPVITATASQPSLTCVILSSDLSASSSAANASYSWSGAGGPIAGNPATVSAAGTYTVTVTDNANGCVSTQTVSIGSDTTPPSVSITPSSPMLNCTTSSVTLNGNASNVTYAWSGAGSGSTSSQNASAPGNYILTVTSTANGCTNSANVTVGIDTVSPGALATVTGTITCTNGSASLTGNSSTAGVNYSWSGPGGFSSTNQNPSASQAGNYILTVTNPANGCSSTSTASVASNTALPTVNAGVNDSIPCGDTLNLNGTSTTAGAQFAWSGPGGFSSAQANAGISAGGQYTLTVTDPANGCTASATVDIFENTVTASFIADTTSGFAPLTVNFTNTSSGATGYSWTFGDNNASTATDPANTFTATGVYTVILIAENGGCSDTASLTIVVDEIASLVIPNVFTPNGDGTNDVFFIKSTGMVELHADIFNRWGEKMYELIGPNDGWDGKNRAGNEASSGTYYVILTARSVEGKTYAIEGYVGLFR